MRRAIKKYWILLLLEILCMILVLPGCFAPEMPVAQSTEIPVGTSLGITQVIGEDIQLTPGVYQVRVKADIMPENTLYVNVQSNQNSFRALRCNGSYMRPYQEYLDFEVYVLDTIEAAHIICDFNGKEEAFIDSMEMYRMNWGSRIVLFVLGLVFGLLDALILFREGILEGTIKKEQQIVFWGLLGSILLAYYPYLTDYMNLGDDTTFHLMRIEGLKESLLQGERFPTKVQNYWLYEHGYAVSAFYGDLFIYIPVLLRLIGFSIMTSYKMFVFLVMAATAVITYYSLKRCTKHSYASMFGSVIYMLTPYRIYNFYNRGAVGEYLAMAFIPLVICGMYELYTMDVNSAQYKKAKIPLIIGLSCILQSHLLSCEMIVGLMLIFCLIFLKKTLCKKTFTELLKAALVCLLVNCGFWYPLFHMMGQDTYLLDEIVSKEIQHMGMGLLELFQIFPNKGTLINKPFQIGIVLLMMLVGTALVIFRKRVWQRENTKKNPFEKRVLFLAGMTALGLVLSTEYFPWNDLAKLPFIGVVVSSLQFPTRFLSPASALGAFFAAYFVLWLQEECGESFEKKALGKTVHKGIVSVLMILTIGASAYHVNDIAYEINPIWLYNAENMGTIFVGSGEYLLAGTDKEAFSYHEPVADEGVQWTNYERHGNQRWLEVSNHTANEGYLEVPVIGYKGYELDSRVQTGEAPYITEQRGAHGDLRIAIPAGFSGKLHIAYKGFFSDRIAEIVSIVSIIGILLFAIKERRSQWKVKA